MKDNTNKKGIYHSKSFTRGNNKKSLRHKKDYLERSKSCKEVDIRCLKNACDDEIIQVSFKSDENLKDYESLTSDSTTARSSFSDESVKSNESATSFPSYHSEHKNKRAFHSSKASKNLENYRNSADNLFHKTRSPKHSFIANNRSPAASIHSSPIKHSTSLDLHKQTNGLIGLKSCPSTPVASNYFTPFKRCRNGFNNFNGYNSPSRERKERGSEVTALAILCQYYKDLVKALKVIIH